MKVNGKSLDAPRIVKVYLPIANDEVVEFKFRPLRGDEDFDKVMTKPKAKLLMKPGGIAFHNIEDPAYKLAVNEWVSRKLDWEFLTSISVTEGLEWATVDMADPATWGNWRTEMEKALGITEINKVFQGFLDAQYISEEVMEKARARFLIGTQEAAEQSQCPTAEV